MDGTILLNYNDNTRIIEQEEQFRFVRSIIEQCFDGNIELLKHLNDIWGETDNFLLTSEQKGKLNKLLSTFGILVVDDLDGDVKVYLENQLIAEWYKCNYKLKKDYSTKEKDKRVYLEMKIRCWSIFEDQEEANNTDEINS